MSLTDLSTLDVIGTLLGFVLTISVFSYIFGDNALFRLAIHIFIGVAAGYTAVVAWYNVIWPGLISPLLEPGGSILEKLVLLIPLALAGLLLMKVSPRLSGLGSPVMAFLVGIGVATAIGGAVLGTLFPQASATINLFDVNALRRVNPNMNTWLALFNASIALAGTLATLVYFHFGADRSGKGKPGERPIWIESLALVGQLFIAIAFGALFAGIYAAALSALVERMIFIVEFVKSLF